MEAHGDIGLRRTPLEPEHRELGAKIGMFAGWAMPIEYAGTLAEHEAVRERAGLFDLMHLGKVSIDGPEAFEVLQRTVTNDLGKVPVGGAQYNNVLNDRGGIVDDVIVYRLGEDRWYTVPNGANTQKVHRILLDRASGADAEIVLHDDLCFLAVQGPNAPAIVGGLFPEAGALDYMHVTEAEFGGARLILSRSGYTG